MKSDDPAVEHELLLAEAEVERLTNLLNSLLTLAREGDRPACVAPSRCGPCRRQRTSGGAPRRGERASLALDGEGDAPVRAGEEDIAIALDNLIENALVYSPPGTTVTISWSPDGRLGVLDEGPGIPPGEEKQVFERFRRGRSDRPGTGLGLAIVETLARRWGGSASIRNRETGGAHAEVRLPVDRTARELEQVR